MNVPYTISEITFNHLPSQQKVTPQIQTEIFQIMELKANKNLMYYVKYL